jgi:hypothetical protein
MCAQYSIYILNHLAKPDLDWRTSIEACFGITPDISALLLFTFYERIYYLDAEVPFPSSKERAGYFVGIAKNIGDALTFWILTEDNECLIARSVLRTAEDPNKPNKRLDNQVNQIKSTPDKIMGMKDFITNSKLPSIDLDQLIGYTFTTEHAGVNQKAEIMKQEADDTYLIEYADGNDEYLTYEEIINMINKPQEDGDQLWTFDRILDHRLIKYDGKQIMEVEVLWDTGEKSWEPLNIIKTDDPVTVAQYVKERNLMDKPYWKWANRYIKNPKRFLRLCRQISLAKKKQGPMYKFGIKVPNGIKEALTIDGEAKNELWSEAVKKELTKIIEFQVFKPAANNTPPVGYQNIPCHIIFDAKFDGR